MARHKLCTIYRKELLLTVPVIVYVSPSGANIGSDLRRKVINDAAASLPAQEALHMRVADAIAPTLPALLRQLDGYRTKDSERAFTLHVADTGCRTPYLSRHLAARSATLSRWLRKTWDGERLMNCWPMQGSGSFGSNRQRR